MPDQSGIIDKLLAAGKRLNFSRGDMVYEENMNPEGLFYLENGLVGLIKTSINGNESLLRVFRSAQFFGHRSLFAMENYHATAKCLEVCTIIFIHKNHVDKCFNDEPEAYHFLAISLAKELRRAELRSMMLAEATVIERVAYTLVLFLKLYPQHLWTRSEIASFCGSRTPTVITALAELERRGLIKQHHRQIHIIDENSLLDFVSERDNEHPW